MSENLKVIWREGMFLQPQHFQQTERFLCHNINGRMTYYQPFYFGISELEIDMEKIIFQSIVIKKCSGIMPDGTMFSIPSLNKAPLSRSFSGHFKYDQQYLTVYLALPSVVSGKECVVTENKRAEQICRFESRLCCVADEVNVNQNKDIELGELCFSILLSDEIMDGFVTLEIANIIKKEDGRFILQEEFVPPLLQTGASNYIVSQLGNLLEKVVNKCNNISRTRKLRKNGLAEFPASEETSFRIFYTLNNYAPLINQFFLNSTSHPYQLYTTLMMFGGAISSFVSNIDIRSFPVYNHIELGSVFGKLFKIILSVLEKEIFCGCHVFTVDKISSTSYNCIIPNCEILKENKIYLGVSSRTPEKELIVNILHRIKICSADKLDLVISSSISGIPIINISKFPRHLPVKHGYVYFAVDTECSLWMDIVNTGIVSLYLPNSYPDIKMEIIALGDQE